MQDNISSKQKKLAITPEDCFIFDERIDKNQLHDPIQISLLRALSLLDLIQTDGEDLNKGFTSQKSVIESLFLVESQINNAVRLLTISKQGSRRHEG